MNTHLVAVTLALIAGTMSSRPAFAEAEQRPTLAVAPLTIRADESTTDTTDSAYEAAAAAESNSAGALVAMGAAPLAVEPESPAASAEAGKLPETSPTGDDSQELAKKLANPVASLISVPFQFNIDGGYGPDEAIRMVLNIQPVIPMSITEDWNLIVRTIVPVIYQGSPVEGVDSVFGMGDVLQSFFFSPKEPIEGWVLAVGPVVLWPTGTDPAIRSEQMGLGPTALALHQGGGWTYGILANHVWAVTQSDDHPDVNSTFLQPFVSYTLPSATTFTLNTESTYDWTGEQWTVPLNGIVSQLVKIGSQPVQFFVGGRYYLEAPENGPEWGIRFGFTLLFPR